MVQLLATAGRALMGGGGKALAGGAEKAAVGAGPRGANAIAEGGAKSAGGSSPMDMLGNVANIAGLGMMIPGLTGGGDKPKEGGEGKQKSHYESAMN